MDVITNLLKAPVRYAKSKIGRYVLSLAAPRMIWGFRSVPDRAFRPRTRISNTAFLYYREKISIDDNVFVWHFTILDGTGGLQIGEGSQIGAWVGIFTHSSHLAIRIYGDRYQNVPESEKECYPIAPVKIGRFVFVAAMSIILPGTTIGDGALISSGSVVRGEVPDFAVMAGSPAEQIGDTREMDKKAWHEKYSENYYQHYIGIPREKWFL